MLLTGSPFWNEVALKPGDHIIGAASYKGHNIVKAETTLVLPPHLTRNDQALNNQADASLVTDAALLKHSANGVAPDGGALDSNIPDKI